MVSAEYYVYSVWFRVFLGSSRNADIRSKEFFGSFTWAVLYMIKTFKNLLLHNRGCLGAESLHESSGTRGQPKLLKELSYVDVWPFYGKVKFASLCICMSSIHLNGKIVKSFKRLLLWSLWANFVQISYGATLGWGNKRLLKLSWSVDQDGRHAHIW